MAPRSRARTTTHGVYLHRLLGARGKISIPTSIAFQWSDAAVGAGSSLVVVGLAIGGYFVLRRRHLQVRVT